MTPELQRIEIAKACGWTLKDVPGGYAPQYFLPPGHTPGIGGYPFWGKSFPDAVPDYLADLNACREMERHLTGEECDIYHEELSSCHERYSKDEDPIDCPAEDYTFHVPAAWKAESFLRAKKLWRDDA